MKSKMQKSMELKAENGSKIEIFFQGKLKDSKEMAGRYESSRELLSKLWTLVML